jgi:hypothetical protein
MRSRLFALLLRQYIEHKRPANLRLHAWAGALSYTAWLSLLARVQLPFEIPLLGANVGALWVLGSALYWARLTPFVTFLVLAWSLAWSATSSIAWPPGLAWLAVVLPVLVMIVADLATRFAHVHHHEHADYLGTNRGLAPALETLHATLWAPFHFGTCALLAAGHMPALRAALDAAERRRILRQEGIAWRNWGRTASCRPSVTCVPQTIADLADAVRDAVREHREVRVVASGFSWSGWSTTDGTMIFCERLDALSLDLSDPERPAVWAECGATNRQLNAFLAASGYQLPWNVVLENVRVAGAVSMGTHGSGRETATVGDLVLALEVIDGNGEPRTLSDETVSEEIMAAARLGLGMFGVIARVKLRIERAHAVLQIDRRLPITKAFEELQSLVEKKDSVELFWFPINDWVWLRTFERTELPITFSGYGFGFLAQNFLHMLAASVHAKVVARVPRLVPHLMRLLPLGISFRTRVLPRTAAVHYRRWLELCRYSCLEVGFKVDERFENVRASFEDARRLVAREAAQGRYPLDLVLNYRFVGPSKALLSPAFGPGISCYPDALCFGRTPGWEAFTSELCSAWMRNPSALPHWAKEFEHVPGLAAQARAHLGDRLPRFIAAWKASGIDPRGTFVNDMVRRTLFGAEGP